MMRFFFKKRQRLKRKKWIKELFSKGNVCKKHPLLFFSLPFSDLRTHQVLFSVPKRRVKQAVMRNQVRRRIREAYRQLQHLLDPLGGRTLLLGFVFVGKTDEEKTYRVLKSAVHRGLMQVRAHYAERNA